MCAPKTPFSLPCTILNIMKDTFLTDAGAKQPTLTTKAVQAAFSRRKALLNSHSRSRNKGITVVGCFFFPRQSPKTTKVYKLQN
jgi:hypothetical protein